MASRSGEVRPQIVLRSTAGTGVSCATRKNHRNTPDRLVLRQYDRFIRAHVEFKESR